MLSITTKMHLPKEGSPSRVDSKSDNNNNM